jgi:uncharacterized protein YecE (DUF72 family)
VIKVGVCSWTERTLVRESDFYPRGTKTPEGMLKHYASEFPIVEADAGFYRLPSEDNAVKWSERTPRGFTFNVKAFRAFTFHPCQPKAIPEDLLEQLPQELRDKKSLYWHDLPDAIQDELLERFRQAQRPLHFGRKLGAILVQFPKWVFPSMEARDQLVRLKKAWPDYRIAIEFRDVSWVSEKNLAETMSFLKANELTYVGVDEPQLPRTLPPIAQVTTPKLAIVRFHGRNSETWNKKVDTAAERFDYQYSAGELREWVPRLTELADKADEVHALMNNCYRDYGVQSARQMTQLLTEAAADKLVAVAEPPRQKTLLT